MNRKEKITLIACAVAMLFLICILVVGIVDGIWPWDGITAYGRLITSNPQAQATFPEKSTEGTDATDPSNAGGSNSDSNANNRYQITESEQNGPPPTLPNEDNVQVGVEVDGVIIPSGGNSSGGNITSGENSSGGSVTDVTLPTESTSPSQDTKPADADAAITFQDLLDALNKNKANQSTESTQGNG